jgi:hypothetical protein
LFELGFHAFYYLLLQLPSDDGKATVGFEGEDTDLVEEDVMNWMPEPKGSDPGSCGLFGQHLFMILVFDCFSSSSLVTSKFLFETLHLKNCQ